MEQVRHSIGDRVVCVITEKLNSNSNNQQPPLVKGRHYIIYDVRYCSKCGTQSVDIGLTTSASNLSICFCGNRDTGNSVRWCASKRFAKIDEQKLSKEEEIEMSKLVGELMEDNV